MSIALNSDICPSLTKDVIEKLNTNNANPIKTVVHFLSLGFSKLRFISRTREIDFEKLLSIREELNTMFYINQKSSFQMLENRINSKMSFNTGIERLDQMLVNGIKCGEITEICGFSGSGKTQLCLTIGLHVITQYEKHVIYIDNDLSFSDQRITEIMRERYNERYSTGTLFTDVQKLKVIQVFDIYSLLNCIERISYDLETNPKSEFNETRLIIIDSLTTPLSLIAKKLNFMASLEDKTNKKRAINLRLKAVSLISVVSNTLHTFCLKHSIAIIVANSRSVTLKNNWKNYCSLSLLIQKIQNSNMRTITISQSKSGSLIHNTFNDQFKITSKGMEYEDY